MKIGRVDLPAITKIDKKPLKGGVYDISINGICFKNSTYADELDVQIENIHSLKSDDLSEPKLINSLGVNSPIVVDKRAAYNFIDYAGLRGFLAVKEISEGKSAEQINLREVSISGFYCPDSIYKRNLKLGITDLENDWGIIGRTLVALPPNSENIEGATELYSIETEDGTVKVYEADGDEVSFDCELSDEELGAVTVWDTNSTTAPSEADLAAKSTDGVAWSKITNPEHNFGDNWIVIENGLVAITLKNGVGTENQGKLYLCNGSGWIEYGRIRQYHWVPGYCDNSIFTNMNSKISFLDITLDRVEIKFECFGDAGGHSSNIIKLNKGRMPQVLLKEYIPGDYSYYQQHYDATGNYTRRFTYFVDDSGNIRLYDSLFATSSDRFSAIQESAFHLRIRDDNIINVIGMSAKMNIKVWPDSTHNFVSLDYVGNYLFYGAMYFDFNKLFKESEDCTLEGGATVDTTQDDDSGDSVLADAQGEGYSTTFVAYTDLPSGTYRLFVRAKDSNQVSNDLRIRVRNTTDAVTLAEETKTLSADFDYYYVDFTIDEDDEDDTIEIRVTKDTTNANSIWLDYHLIVPITNGKNFPQDIAHDAMRLVEPQRVLKVG